jgi:Ca-activated chloride channel family protein
LIANHKFCIFRLINLLKAIFYIATIAFLQSIAVAQGYYLKGEVRDEAGKTLPNVSILQHSTGYVYYSGQSGAFGLILAKQIDSLSFSADGFQKQKVLADASKYLTVILKRQPKGSASPYKLASLTENLRREAQQQWFLGDETYTSIIENQFINTKSYPSTGVTLNVDRASYSNIRRFINMQMAVPPDAVRIEEMLNYFNFNYTEPKNSKTFEIETVLR